MVFAGTLVPMTEWLDADEMALWLGMVTVHADLMAELVSERLIEEGMARPGDRVVLVHGSPLGVPGHTNSIRLHEILPPGERGPGSRYRVPV